MQTAVAFPLWLPGSCSSALAGLRRPVLTAGHGTLPWTSLETTSAAGLSSAPHGSWQPPTACSCECVQCVPGHLCCYPCPLCSPCSSRLESCRSYLHLCPLWGFPSALPLWWVMWEMAMSWSCLWDLLKVIGPAAVRAVAKPELMQCVCQGEKLLLSSPGNKWLIREEPEGMYDCWIRKLYGWL